MTKLLEYTHALAAEFSSLMRRCRRLAVREASFLAVHALNRRMHVQRGDVVPL